MHRSLRRVSLGISLRSPYLLSLTNAWIIGLSNFAEPCHVVYDVENKDLTVAIHNLKSLVSRENSSEDKILTRCTQQRIERIALMDQAILQTVRSSSIIHKRRLDGIY